MQLILWHAMKCVVWYSIVCPIQYSGYLISFLGLSGQGVGLSIHTHLVPE